MSDYRTTAPDGIGSIDVTPMATVPKDEAADPKIDTPGDLWREMEQWRALPRQLRGGLKALQSLLVAFSEKESADSFQRRKLLLDFVPFYWGACGHLGGLPFTKPAVEENIPDKVMDWGKNIDGQETDLPLVLRSLSIQSVGFGKIGVLLLPREDNPAVPTLHIIDTQDDLDDQAEGRQPMRFRRWVSTYPDPDRPWWKRREEQIWTLYPGNPEAGENDDEGQGRWVTWTVHEREDPGKGRKSEWNDNPTEEKGGTITGMWDIPYVPWTAASLSEDEAPPWLVFPPLWWLARLNFIHMNKRSDADHGLRWGNVEQPYLMVPDPDDKRYGNMNYGGGTLWLLQSGEGVAASMLSPTGVGYTNASNDLKDLEMRADRMAHKTTANRFIGPHQTATGKKIDLKEATSLPQSWTYGWSDSATTLLRMVGQWMGERPESTDSYAYTLPADFDAELAWEAIRESLHKIADRGELLPEDYLPMLAQVGGFPPGVDDEQIAEMVTRAKEQAEERAKALASLPVPPRGQADEEADEEEEEDEDNEGLEEG